MGKNVQLVELLKERGVYVFAGHLKTIHRVQATRLRLRLCQAVQVKNIINHRRCGGQCATKQRQL